MRQDSGVNKPGKGPHKGGGGNHGGNHKDRKPGGQSAGSRAPEQTFEEVRYLKYLIENQIPVRVRLDDNSEVSGTIEYYDHSFIRLTREPAEPNLFIFKRQIKYFYELSA